MESEKVVYKVPEVAKILRVNPKSVYELITQEKIKCIRVGRLIRIPRDYLEDYIKLQ